MSAESDVYTALSVWSPLGAIVGPRIYPDALPESAAYPAVVYERPKTDPVFSISGTYFGSSVTLSITAWGISRTEVKTVGDEIVNACIAAGIGYAARSSGFDNESGLFADVVGVELFDPT